MLDELQTPKLSRGTCHLSSLCFNFLVVKNPDSSTMQKPKQRKPKVLQKPMSTKSSWLDLIITDDDPLRPVIPVGPRFQADIPDWTGPPSKNGTESNTWRRWLGTRVWPIKSPTISTSQDDDTTAKLGGAVIGKGRPEFCSCASPGSIECIKRHVNEKRMELQFELGPAFWRWRFDEMGKDVSSLWSWEEQKKFEIVVKSNPISEGKGFMKPALESLPSKSRETIVSYYFNVYVPRRMSIRSRIGCEIIDTDTEDDDNEIVRCSKSSRKRYRADSFEYVKSKYLTDVKSKYLTGRR